MTETEQLRSEVRELKMRLREYRTENAELKLQQKRWLTLSTGVSVFSLLLAVFMFFISGDIKVEHPTQGSQIYSLDPKPSQAETPLNVKPSPKSVTKTPIKEDPKPMDSSLFLDAPDLGLDLDLSNPTPFSKKSVSPQPSRGGGFELPGLTQGTKKKVIQYTVKKNDTLWNIADKMMGSPKQTNINKIMKDNGLTQPRIDPGMVLVIIVEK